MTSLAFLSALPLNLAPSSQTISSSSSLSRPCPNCTPLSLRRSPLISPPQASSAEPSSDPKSLLTDKGPLDAAVAHCAVGNFALAASALSRSTSPPPPASRASYIRALLDPITLERVAAGIDDPQLFDSGIRALYTAMAETGLLPLFAADRLDSRPDGYDERSMTAEKLVAVTGLPLAALSPKQTSLLKWNLAGIAAVFLTVNITRSLGVERLATPAVGLIGLLLALDQAALKGVIGEAATGTLFPAWRRRVKETVAWHEAGHMLVAYLSGLQISGYVLSGTAAAKANIPSFGQGGTLFLFPELQQQLSAGRVKGRSIDTWSTVLMAGIAAEALQFGQAKGGASDEQTLTGFLAQLKWSEPRVRAQAKYGVMRACTLLQRNKAAHKALCEKMLEGAPLGECVAVIEELVEPVSKPKAAPVDSAVTDAGGSLEDEEERMSRREAEVLEQLASVKKQIKELDS